MLPEPYSNRIGRYRILAELGQGGTANVCLAEATGPAGFSKLVVLKRMKPKLASEPGFTEMFMTEARLAARLNHPNIVQTNEVFSDEELPVIVMQYLEGQTLTAVAARAKQSGAFQLRHHLEVLSRALLGLHYSHELRDYDGRLLHVVHRDMTPHNLFVSFEGEVKVLDFGIAKLAGSRVETETGVIKGKLRYIPPEQILGERVDRRADIYSVGVMLWEAAVGDRMWGGLSDAEIMSRVINGNVPSACDVNPEVSSELNRIIMKALSPDPNARYLTADALRLELEEYRAEQQQPVSAAELGLILQQLFADVRERTRALIGAQLSGPAPSGRVEGAETESPSESLSTNTAVTRYGPLPTTRSGRRFAALAVFVVLGFGVVLFWRQRVVKREAPGDGVAAADSVQPSKRAPDIESVSRVAMVRVTAFPKQAQIWVDGRTAGQNPYAWSVPIDGRMRVLRVEADGYVSQVQQLTIRRDTELVVNLLSHSPQTAGSTGLRSKPPPGHSAVVGGGPQRSKEVPDCSPPFMIDDRGIKRFKLECM